MSLSIQQELSIIAEMAYGHGKGEGVKGGEGRIGLVGGHVVKFNTHFAERVSGPKANRDMRDSCNALRAKLLDIARRAGLDDNQIGAIRKQLGLKPSADPASCKKLLDRKVVAKVVNLISGGISGGASRVVWGAFHHSDVMRSQGDMSFATVAKWATLVDARLINHMEKTLDGLIRKHFPSVTVSPENLKALVEGLNLAKIVDLRHLWTAEVLDDPVSEAFGNIKGRLMDMLGVSGPEVDALDDEVFAFQELCNSIQEELTTITDKAHLPGWKAIARACDTGRISPEVREHLELTLSQNTSAKKVEKFIAMLDNFTTDPFTAEHLNRMETLFKNAGRPTTGAKDLLGKMDCLRASQICSGKLLTAEDVVAYFEKEPRFFEGLDLSLDLAGNRDAIQKDFLSFLKSGYENVAQKAKDDPGTVGGEANVFMLAVREYGPGGLTVEGQSIPLNPSPDHKEVKGSGVAGTDAKFRQAMVEKLVNTVSDKGQRLMVSYLMSMANGVEGYFTNRFQGLAVNQENPCNRAVSTNNSMLLSNGTCVTSFGHNPPHFDLSIDAKTGAVNLNMRICMTQGYTMFAGASVPGEVSVSEAAYAIELSIPKPKPGEAPKLELLRLENL